MQTKFEVEYIHGDLIFLLECVDTSSGDELDAAVVGISLDLGGHAPIRILTNQVPTELFDDMERWAAGCIPAYEPTDDDMERSERRGATSYAAQVDDPVRDDLRSLARQETAYARLGRNWPL
jgi:hypothetical protein